MKKHIDEIDFLKGVCIVLMVIFHLAYIGDKYPMAKQVVYTFHMPVFLFLSGYLTNTDKGLREFARKYLWIFIPYLCMETAYAVASYVLPVRDGLKELNAATLLRTLLAAPVGPYWYLHTFMLCSFLYYLPVRYLRATGLPTRLVVTGIGMYLAAGWGGLMGLANAFYFLLGGMVAQGGIGFFQLFRPAWAAVVPLAVCCLFPEQLHRETLTGFCFTYLMICLLLWLHRSLPRRLRQATCHVGRHTLALLLFSPIFTMLAKSLLPLFRFDPTGMLFLLTATALAVGGSLGIEWGMKRTGISRYFFGPAR